MDRYRLDYKILASDVDAGRRLRLSRLFTLLQEAAIAHTEALGWPRETTLDRGFLWVVTLQETRVARLPRYDERVTLESVPGDMMHTFYPRFYRLTDANGETLLTSSALWALMDVQTRAMCFPDRTGVVIGGQKADWETFFPAAPRLPAEGAETPFTVPYSYVDLNGHMNNTRYFDLAEDLMDADLRERRLLSVKTEYSGEARCSETLSVRASRTGNEFRVCGSADKRLFRFGFVYSEERDPRYGL